MHSKIFHCVSAMMNPVTKISALSRSGAWGYGCGADGNDRYGGYSFLGLIPRIFRRRFYSIKRFFMGDLSHGLYGFYE